MFLTENVKQLIRDAYAEGSERFGDLGLDFQTYTNRMQVIIHKYLGAHPPEEDVAGFVKGLHGRDLYLATACAKESYDLAAGGPPEGSTLHSCPAWRTLSNTYKSFMDGLARFLFHQCFWIQDLADDMLADLFFPDSSGASRILSYDGRSSLCTWLRVVFCNRAINVRRGRSDSQTAEIESDIPDKPALKTIDRVMHARRYGADLESSALLACSALTPKERSLLLWRYDDELRLGQIAELLGVHQSTVTRRLDRMHARVRDQIVTALSDRHGLSSLAIQECLTDLVENPHHPISILDCIRSAGCEPTAWEQ